ncbi:hypothetical protein HHK36_001071 [Tetracentron sinense]|uniref:RING-type domain-containing protein n=1 Tax=Tetracentron sinense TaxID=13715 RepID=A0A834ZWZ9_TETSI|nr:hypothetical protein HHK36_001071 [Tetracentron sinense]
MLGSGMNLITTVIGFGMSATFIVFVCTRLICGRIRPVDSRPVFEMDSRADLEQVCLFVSLFLCIWVSGSNSNGFDGPEHRISGLEPVVVAAIPTMKFNREAFRSVEDAQCTICLGEYQEKEVLRIMPKCGHNFHLACIDVWLQKQSTCPVCRLPLQDSVETKDARPPMFESMDGPEIVTDHSHQWLLPGRERSVGNGSNEGHRESVSGNQEGTLTGSAGTMR